MTYDIAACVNPHAWNWQYPEGNEHFPRAGEFWAWIGGSARNRHSAAAWRVESKSNPSLAFETTKASVSETSTSQRAVLAALVGVAESLVTGSSADVFTRNKYAADAVELLSIWKAQGWEGADGQLANVDILRRLDRVLSERQIVMRVHLVTGGKPVQADRIIERMTRLARAMTRLQRD